jgi:glucose dehydrogenase
MTACDSSCFITADDVGNVYYQAHQDVVRINSNGQIDWNATMPISSSDNTNWAVPVVSTRGDFLIVGSNVGVLKRFVFGSGSAPGPWTTNLGESVNSLTLSPAEDVIYISAGPVPYGPYSVYALDAASGKVLWHKLSSPEIGLQSISEDGKIVVLQTDEYGQVSSLSATTGSLVAQERPRGRNNMAIPCALDSKSNLMTIGQYYRGNDTFQTTVSSYQALTGKLRWETNVTFNTQQDQGIIVFPNNRAVAVTTLFLGSLRTSNIFLLDTTTGAVLKTWAYTGIISPCIGVTAGSTQDFLLCSFSPPVGLKIVVGALPL